jgi:hypothetical protein
MDTFAMKILTMDAETFFSDTFTLSKLTTEEYVRSPEFEVHGWAVQHEHDAPFWLTHEEAAKVFKQADWSNTAVLAHHAHFDLLILKHVYGVAPAFILDTLSMGRVVFGPGLKLNLESLAARFSLQPKSVPYAEMRGKRWHEMPPDLQRRVASGAMHDCSLTRTIADFMLKGGPNVPYPFPASELAVVDLTVRMFTEPVLVGDIEALGEAWQAEQVLKKDLFRRASEMAGATIEPADLRKDALFAQLLEQFGVEPETKVTARAAEKAAASGTDPVAKYAFAKSDWFMQNLLIDEDEDVALLAECRLKAQSSIYQTRIERYGSMALRGAMCIYLAYGAAHTRRHGGGDKTNFQNLPRPDKTKPQKGALRRAIKAPQ